MGIAESLKRGTDLASKTVKDTIEFVREKFLPLFTYMLVSYGVVLLAAGIAVVLALITLLPAGVFEDPSTVSVTSFAVVLVAALLIVLAGMVLSQGVRFSAIKYVMTGERQPFFSGKNIWLGFQLIVFFIVVFGAIAVVVLLPFLLGLLGPGGAIAGLLIFAVLALAAAILFLMLVVASVYLVYEMAAGNIGPIEALKKSWALVRGNFWETVLMWLVVYAVSYGLGLVLSVVLIALYVLVFIIPIVGIVLLVLFSIIAEAAVEAVVLPLWILFWKELKVKKRKAA